MKKTTLPLAIVFMVQPILFMACKKDPVTPEPTVVKEWKIVISPKNQNPAPAGRMETGTANLSLLSNNSLKYVITVNGLAAGDALVAAHIHAGNVISNGSVVLGLDPMFTGATATGTISNVRSSFVDSLKSDDNELYFNLHSTQQPGGLLRGQLNENIVVAEDVVLLGTNEVVPVTTMATGIAILRLTDRKKLYSRVTVTTLDAGDAMMAAHIHTGAAGVNGGVIVTLCANAEDFGVAKMFTLTDPVFTSVKMDAVYVNAHSSIKPGGLVRGQIR